MKTLHTLEPWVASKSDPLLFGSQCGTGMEPIGFVYGPAFADRSEVGKCAIANARRIVAAVNACEGISTELLEGAALMAKHIKGRERLSAYTARIEAQRDQMEIQRDQLLAALEAVLANCLDAEGLSAAYANARAAIAAVKGN